MSTVYKPKKLNNSSKKNKPKITKSKIFSNANTSKNLYLKPKNQKSNNINKK